MNSLRMLLYMNCAIVKRKHAWKENTRNEKVWRNDESARTSLI